MRVTSVDLIFDGQCGFCTRAVNWILRLDKHSRLRVHPSQRAGVRERFRLSPDDRQEAAWAITPQQRISGAGAINLSLDAALGVSLFSPLYRLPGVRWAQDRIYAWVSSHRYLLRGTVPWCTSRPEDCELAVEGMSCSLPGPSTNPVCSA